jgi:sec-independent protein translocase protein TatA
MGEGLLQPGHLLLILIIVLVIFGPGKLPELGSALGQGIRELKQAMDKADGDPTPPGASALGPSAGIARATRGQGAPCPQCQAPTPTDARHCTGCGRPLGTSRTVHPTFTFG